MVEHHGAGVVGIRVNSEYTYKLSGFLFFKKVPNLGPAHCMLATPNNSEAIREGFV